MYFKKVKIDDELERTFRRKLVTWLGGMKGSIRLAVDEAIKLWLKKA